MRPALVTVCVALVAGCASAHDRDPSRDADLACETRAMDLLLVIQNTGSVTASQIALADALPGFLSALLAGADAQLHVAVLTGDLGGAAALSADCAGEGDAGRFVTRGADPMSCPMSLPPYFAFSASALDGTALRCAVVQGSGGCSFQQPLEAVLVALATEETGLVLVDGREPQGGRANRGFLRPDSTLVVLLLGTEDDCSVRSSAVFDPSTSPCPIGEYCCDAALSPLGRFIDGLGRIRGEAPVLPIVIAGVPSDLAPLDPAEAEYDRVLGDPRLFADESVCGRTPSARGAPRLVGFAVEGFERPVISSVCGDALEARLAAMAEYVRRWPCARKTR